jgi:acetylornithine deacetylase/succinyl-diaminopimelate desuccinylase-like protein
MRSEDGHVLIEGFYDEVRPAGQMERDLIAAIPDADALVMRDAGISGREYPGLRYEETLLLPALNIRGLEAGGVEDKARNIIDSRAIASIGIRMAPDMTIAKTIEVIEAHIRAEGYYIVREAPTLEERLAHPKIARVVWGKSGYPAVRTNPDDPYVQKLIAIMQEVTEGGTIIYPTLGGSLPLAHIVLPLEVPFAVLPIANQDNSQHAPNENIRLGHLFRGIEIYAAVLAGLGN